MASIAIINATLNAVLWALHSLLAYVIESIYVNAAKIELDRLGSTSATNADETDAVRLFLRLLFPPASRRAGLRRRCCEGGPCGTAPWAIGLMISGLLFLPAELVAETGIDLDEYGGVAEVVSTEGVCVKRFQGSDLGTAANALFIQRVEWMDSEWEVVLEGASANMNRMEVRVEGWVNASKALGRDCIVEVGVCAQCGRMVVKGGDEGFGVRVVEIGGVGVEGFVASDGNVHAAFGFYGVGGGEEGMVELRRIRVRGGEMLLMEEEYERVVRGGDNGTQLELNDERTRMYDVSCFLVGVSETQLAKALALYRKMQLERPVGMRNKAMRIEEIRPLNATEALHAAFAFMADDPEARCARPVVVYRSSARYHWRQAVFMAIVTLIFLVCWVVIFWKARDLDEFAPYDISSWRAFALDSEARKGVRAQVQNTSNGKKFMMRKVEPDEDEDQNSSP